MIVMSTYAIRPGCVPEAVGRFLSGKATPPSGVKILGRWHKSDFSGGYALFETDNPTAIFEFAAYWGDVVESHSNVVIEDAEAAAALAKIYGK
jgi:Protein of unknown function (DUF3303)